MSYEKGDKFALEIAEVFKSEDKTLYRAKNFASLVFDENGLQKFRRIRETNEEAYRRGYEDGKSEVNKERVEHHVVEPSAEQLAKARADGAEEVWTFFRKVYFDENSLEYKWDSEVFGVFDCYSTYAEARAAFEAWKAEQEKPWEPKVGDVVSCYGEKGILLEIIGDSAYVMWKNEGCGYCELKDMSPTGEYVDVSPIFEVLK